MGASGQNAKPDDALDVEDGDSRSADDDPNSSRDIDTSREDDDGDSSTVSTDASWRPDVGGEDDAMKGNLEDASTYMPRK